MSQGEMRVSQRELHRLRVARLAARAESMGKGADVLSEAYSSWHGVILLVKRENRNFKKLSKTERRVFRL
jgi:hypothetical protein